MTTLPWQFEPCENEGPVCDPQGQPWQHAVRGRKPAGRLVIGYGHTLPAADHDAREKAQRFDAREMIGERGEAKIASENLGGFEITPEMWEACQRFFDAGIVVKMKLGGEMMKMSVLKVKTDE